jgi:anionic cell wall polymer biosynthesis LytR-Cps2A-Psr (LCP) family protein
MGIPIDRFVLLDMVGVREIVDQLGGIDVDVPETIVDDQFPTETYGTKTLRIPAGRQRLNGELALAYARTRHQDSDFGRMARQQQVIAAVLAEMKRPAAAPRLPAIIKTLQQSTRTDLRPADYAFVAQAGARSSGDRVRRLVIGPDLVTSLTGVDGAALLQPRPALRAAVASFLAAS